MKKILALILVLALLSTVSFAAEPKETELVIPKGTTLKCYSGDDIRAVAERLYNHTNPETETTKDIRRAYEKGEYLGSLILYRKLVIDRLRKSVGDIEASLHRYYYGWDQYYTWADVMAGVKTWDERLQDLGIEYVTTKDPMNMLGFPNIDEPSHVNWLPCYDNVKLETGGMLSYESLNYLVDRASNTGDYVYVRKLYQYLEDYADNLPVQNIEHFGWGDAPLLERSFQKANVRLDVHFRDGYPKDYNYALAPQDINARKLGFCLGKANLEFVLFYTLALSAKVLPRKEAEHDFNPLYPKTLFETSYTDELSDEAYDIIDPVRLTKIMLYILEYDLPVLGATMESYSSVSSANIGVAAYSSLARMTALLQDFDSALGYADRNLPNVNKIFEETQFKDGGFMESHFNYNQGEAANKRALYNSIIGIAPEFKKYLTRDLGDDANNWDLVEEGYSGMLLPNVGNLSNYGTSEIWKKVPEQELVNGRQLQDYKSIYYPYSGLIAQRSGWLYDDFSMSSVTKSQRYSGHGFAQSNAILQLQAYGRMLILNGGMPFYGKSYAKNFPEFLENGYDEINSYMGERSTRKSSTVMVNRKSQTTAYYDFDDNGVLKKGQRKQGYFENFNEQIYNARWLSDDSFDFGEGYYDKGWTLWDSDGEVVYSDEIENLPMEQAITNDAAHNREFIYVKDADLWIVLDKMTNTHNEGNEYSCMWHFPAEGMKGDWRLTGFENEEVEIMEEENLVRTNDKDGPNLYIYNVSNEPLTYQKYYGFWEKGNREAYGWSLGNGNVSPPELGQKYVPRPEVHVRWTDSQKGDVTRLASVLAPSKNTDNPISSMKNISDGNITGFELETASGAKVYFYSSDAVNRYSIGDVTVNAKEAVFVEKDGAIKVLALDSTYMEKDNVSLSYMLDSNCSVSFDKNMTVTNVSNFGVPETFAWQGDKKTAGAHRPVYTSKAAEEDYSPAEYAQDVYTHWARYYVLKLEENGIIAEGREFGPDNPITRADFVKWLVKASGAELAEYAGSFADVPFDSEYAEYIQTANNLGWIAGDNGEFYPDSCLTREEMAVIIAKVLGDDADESAVPKKNFADAESIAGWAKSAVAICLADGIVSGDENFNFHPTDTFSRAEAAKVIARIFCGAY